ncbi:MAG: cytidylate kinase [Planctomycetes bacterium]|nr:cytidylate kinase [Planctomycetota bacterium]
MAHEDSDVLTVDGPAGVGKSSVARRVATRLGFFHLDTGAMYRAVTLAALRAGVATAAHADEARLAPVLAHWVGTEPVGTEPVATESVATDPVATESIGTAPSSARGTSGRRMRVGGGGKVWLDDEDVSNEVRGAAVTALVSPVSAVPSVRAALVEWQRALGAEQATRFGGVVVEGRDAGSHIFPHARWRFYLDASLLERAHRRLHQQAGTRADPHELTETMEGLAQRDRIDRERTVAPLCIPDGATVLDTTHVALEQVVAAICDVVEAARGGKSSDRPLDPRPPGSSAAP